MRNHGNDIMFPRASLVRTRVTLFSSARELMGECLHARSESSLGSAGQVRARVWEKLTPGIDGLNLKQKISCGVSSLSIGWIRSAKSHRSTYELST